MSSPVSIKKKFFDNNSNTNRNNNSKNNNYNNVLVTLIGAVKFLAQRVSNRIQSESGNTSGLEKYEFHLTVGTLMRQLETTAKMRKIFITIAHLASISPTFTHSFNVRRSQKCKKTTKSSVTFLYFWEMWVEKLLAKFDEIN